MNIKKKQRKSIVTFEDVERYYNLYLDQMNKGYKKVEINEPIEHDKDVVDRNLKIPFKDDEEKSKYKNLGDKIKYILQQCKEKYPDADTNQSVLVFAIYREFYAMPFPKNFFDFVRSDKIVKIDSILREKRRVKREARR